MPNASATFQPIEFYHLAWWLYSVKPALSEQSLKRTIIGRAYYAALLAGSDKTGTSTTGQNSHQNVIIAVQNINSQAANNLREINKLRRRADYEKPDLNERDVQICLHKAKNVLEILGFIPLGTTPTITKDYLDKNKFYFPCQHT